MAVYQIFVRLLDGRTQCLQIPSATVSGEILKREISWKTGIPLGLQRLVSGSREIRGETLISVSEDGIFPSCALLLRLRGGKGGFGSLLRGAATKAGQKKTLNFDACRDMSGRRLRHVNAEKKLEEWKADAEERKLEKIAEEFLRKKAKEVRKRSSAVGEKYIEKYKEDSARCMEEVEESVRKSFDLYEKSKRKVLPSSGPASKRLKICLGKTKVVESESEDDDDSEDEKSVALDDGSHKKEEGSSGSASGSTSDAEYSVGGSGASGLSCLDDENGLPSKRDVDLIKCTGSGSSSSDSEGAAAEPERTFCEEGATHITTDSSLTMSLNSCEVHGMEKNVSSEAITDKQEDIESKVLLPSEVSLGSTEARVKMHRDVKDESLDQKEAVPQSLGATELEESLIFEKFSSAVEMEVLGMDRLKSELQARGLKCGGTLQERAARLFLLKTTAIDKLAKKLLAKPSAAGK